MWTCPFCLQRNQFPPHYKDISEVNLPAELLPDYTTIEYTLSRQSSVPPIFLFVVDTCLEDEELVALKEALLVSLSLLPPNALVGVITYGSMVYVHELGFTEMSKCFVFRGTKDYASKQIQEMLGLSAPVTKANQPPNYQGLNRFLLPVQECEFALNCIFEELQKDPWPVKADHRPARATGSALSIAISLLESSFPDTGARIMLFTGGACTSGPGMVVDCPLKEPLRSHHMIEKGTAKYYKSACKFYNDLANRAAKSGHAIDILAGSLDQVGIDEMKKMPNSTGGVIVFADSFSTSIFKQSCQKIFQLDSNGYIKMGFNAMMDVHVSRELKICGLIGPAVSLEKKTGSISETEIGIGLTSAWRLPVLTPRTSTALYFEICNTGNPSAQHGSRGLVQFATKYQHPSGEFRLRVTTVARSIVNDSDPQIANSFDQEAATVLIARIAVLKSEHDEANDVMRWLDRMLIRLCQKFAVYHKGDPQSFRMSEVFSFYPQFMFHLRRSQFLIYFNYSCDESTFYKHSLNRENVLNSLIMIQPTLTAYSLESPPRPVLLDSSSIQPDLILLLDTFFYIIIWHGENIAQWRKEGYQDKPEFQNFKDLLEAPIADAIDIISERYPVPRYRKCDQNDTQSRFLVSKINPSTTHQSDLQYGQAQGQTVFTDDVSLQVFMDHLTKLVVSGTT